MTPRMVSAVLLPFVFCAAAISGCASQKPLPSPTPTPGTATVRGRIVLGYGDHSPVVDLPLWIGKESLGPPAARTDANGEFTLRGLPVGGVIDVVDDHLTFQVQVTSGGVIDAGTFEYPLVHP